MFFRLASMLQEELHVRKENFDYYQSELCRRIAREQDLEKGNGSSTLNPRDLKP